MTIISVIHLGFAMKVLSSNKIINKASVCVHMCRCGVVVPVSDSEVSPLHEIICPQYHITYPQAAAI